MGAPDILAKALFAAHTAAITDGACAWLPPSEVPLNAIEPDGFLLIYDTDRLRSLPAPWRLFEKGEVLLEIKMPGDHMDQEQWLRALLRRAARDVERHLNTAPGTRALHETLCFLSPYLPDWLDEPPAAITLEAPGCHRIHTGLGPTWWITANDLPLEEALLPFLLARSGKHRVELAQWLSQKRDFSTVREMIRVFRMNKVNLQDYLHYEKEDEEAGDRALREFLEAGLEAFPDIADKIRREAQEEARHELQEARRELQEAHRKAQEEARREAQEEARREAQEARREAQEAERKAREESLRAVLLQVLRLRFGADEATWAPRLAPLDVPALEALILRASQVDSEDALLT
jgi:vacuolar-type H+-ATPase subunit H